MAVLSGAITLHYHCAATIVNMAPSIHNAIPLLPAVARRDVEAFEALYDRHASTLFAVLIRILSNPEDAREVLQETFVQIWNRADQYDSERGSEMAWLVSICRNRGIDRIRARKLREIRESEAGIEILSRGPDVSVSTGTDDVLRSETQKLIRRALEDLPAAQRTALELAYFEGLSQSEIARKLREPLGTVKTRMHLGMKKLRDGLKQIYRT